MLKHLQVWWAAHVAWISAAVLWFKPSVDSFLAAHPHPTIAAFAALLFASSLWSGPNTTGSSKGTPSSTSKA